MINPFAEKYKKLSIAQLLEIIDTPENYQAAAVIAAEDELLRRNLSILEMVEARAENEAGKTAKEGKANKRRAFEDKLVNAANTVIDTFHPVQKTPASVNRVILLISIVFAILGAVQLYYFVKYLPISLNTSYHIPISFMLPLFFEGFFLLGTAFMFWKRKKWGWVFLGIYLAFSIAGAFVNVMMELWREVFLPRYNFDFIYTFSPVSILFSILFYGCCLWYLFKSAIRGLYKIDKYLGIIVAAAGVFLGLLVFVLLLHR